MTIDLVEEPLVYVSRTSGHWAMSSDPLEEYGVMVARGVRTSSRGTKYGAGRARGAVDLSNERSVLYLLEEL